MPRSLQFGIPPETIKDSMQMGLTIPSVYIVPVERFCREMGPALGVNLAEFEFPAYFNFFVFKKRCTLVVDSEEAERNIRRVFNETLLGPSQFRRKENPLDYEEEDFAPDFPKDAIPNLRKELEHFRIFNGNELVLETLLNFCHFDMPGDAGVHENLGIPPPLEADVKENVSAAGGEAAAEDKVVNNDPKVIDMSRKAAWTYSQARWIGKLLVLHQDVSDGQILTCQLSQQVMSPLFGLLTPRKKRLRIVLVREWRFSKCQEEQSTLCTISTRTTTSLARQGSLAM